MASERDRSGDRSSDGSGNRSSDRSGSRPSRPGGGRASSSSAGYKGSGRPARESDKRTSDGRTSDRRTSDRRAAERSDRSDRPEAPEIPDDITGQEADTFVRQQLRSLPDRLAINVARRLVAAAQTIDSDPETAYRHSLEARARASRVGVVREACGEAAYAAGHFKEALTELRAARRITGDPLYLPMMADCERALGRPERALALSRDPGVALLDEAGQVEMRIVASGARRDRGETAAAVALLEGPQLRSRSTADWSPRLRYAYADALLADGRRDAAREWFERAAGVDRLELTDANDRIAALDAE